MQQINLYTDDFKPVKIKLPLEHIILFPIIFLFVIIACSFGMSAYLSNKNDELLALQSKHDSMAARIKVLNEKAEKLRQDDALIAANERLKQTYQARENIIATLDRVVLKEVEGYSPTLVALARQKEKGLWLTTILIGSANKQMVLQGVTRKAELVPSYLQNLRKEASFIGRQFALFELNENEDQGDWLSFTLKAEKSELNSSLMVETLATQTTLLSDKEELQ